ncbi:MAG TPA: hypothetical protein VGE72_03965 [Azospirillum sp.]
MAELHHFRRPPPPRRTRISGTTLAWIMLLAGGLAAFLSLLVPPLRGLSTLVGLGVAIGGYIALYNRSR